VTNSYKYGNGLLILGAVPLDVTAQMTKLSVQASESVETIDAIPVLDNTEIPEEEEATYKFTISGTLLQDLAAAGVLNWSWANKGTQQAFIFVPDNPTLRGVEGILVPQPLTIGGEVTKPKNRPTSDFEWRIIGTPIFGVFDPGGAGHLDDDVDEDA
jgi:hypothetical protein